MSALSDYLEAKYLDLTYSDYCAFQITPGATAMGCGAAFGRLLR